MQTCASTETLALLLYHCLHRLALTLFCFVFVSESHFGSNISDIFMFLHFDILLLSCTHGILSWQPNYDFRPYWNEKWTNIAE